MAQNWYLDGNGRKRLGADSILNHPTLNTGLISYYSFDEDGSDLKGSNDLTISGATIASGIINKCREYNGSSDYSEGTIDISGFDGLTIGAWIYVNSLPSSYSEIINLGDKPASGANVIRLYVNDTGKLNLQVVHPAYTDRRQSTSSTGAITTGQWYLVIGTYDESSAHIYINGELADDTFTNSGTAPLMSDFTNTNFSVGASADDGGRIDYFNGKIGELPILSRVVTPSEIRALYNNSIGLPYSVGY